MSEIRRGVRLNDPWSWLVAGGLGLALALVVLARPGGPALLVTPDQFDPPDMIERTLADARERLKEHPDDLEAQVALAVAAFQKGRAAYPTALNAVHRAWRLGAADHALFFYAGTMYDALGLYPQASEEFEKFLRHEPRHEIANLRLGSVYYRQKRLEDATDRFETAYRTNPRNPVTLANLGRVYAERGLWDEAADKLSAAIEVSSPIAPPPGTRELLAEAASRSSRSRSP